MKDDELRDVELRLTADDGYVLTAIPLITLLKLYQELKPKPIGLHLMGEVLLENPLIDDLKEVGNRIEVGIQELSKKESII